MLDHVVHVHVRQAEGASVEVAVEQHRGAVRENVRERAGNVVRLANGVRQLGEANVVPVMRDDAWWHGEVRTVRTIALAMDRGSPWFARALRPGQGLLLSPWVGAV